MIHILMTACAAAYRATCDLETLNVHDTKRPRKMSTSQDFCLRILNEIAVIDKLLSTDYFFDWKNG